jgi:hypothetical protein
MAFTKIQPQQVQLATFLSPSGDLTFTDNVTGVSANLSRSLAGDFNFTDSLTISSSEVITSAASNSSTSSSIALGGTSNVVSGSNNVLVNGTANTQFSGNYNVLVNGTLNDFGASGQNNTILAGRQCSFDDKVTGAVILADHETTLANNVNHSLTVGFSSGVTFRAGDVEFDSHLKVNANHSGILSGNVHVGGTAYFNNDVTVGAPMTVTDSLTLDDGSDAASQVWVDERVGFSLTESVDNTLTTTLEGGDYSAINATNLENVLTGASVGSDVFTGHVLTGTSVAYFVVQGANFTGAIPFPNNSYRAI